MKARYHVVMHSMREEFEQTCGKYLTGGWTFHGPMQFIDRVYFQVFYTYQPEYPDFNLEGVNNAQS